jgi:uncharacterized CHY-type Zn-finger protein
LRTERVNSSWFGQDGRKVREEMSAICRVCAEEMSKDRHGAAQICPDCLERIRKRKAHDVRERFFKPE